MGKLSEASLVWGIVVEADQCVKWLKALEADSDEVPNLEEQKDKANEEKVKGPPRKKRKESVNIEDLQAALTECIEETDLFRCNTHVSDEVLDKVSIEWILPEEEEQIQKNTHEIWGYDNYASTCSVIKEFSKDVVYAPMLTELNQYWPTMRENLKLERAGIKFEEGWILGLSIH